MILFSGSKILRSNGYVNAFDISVEKTENILCYLIKFNDGSQIILPKGAKIHLENSIIEIDTLKIKFEENKTIKFKPKFFKPKFVLSNLDPYLIGIAICTPIRNRFLQTRKEFLLDIEKFPKDYYSFSFEKKSNKFYKLSAKEGYPNLLRLEIKKQGNFKNLENRQIPDKYLFSKYWQRVFLLRGCMDVFGHVNKGEVTFETCSQQLSIDICFLVRSLGGFAKIRKKKSKKIFYITSISFKGNFNPFEIKKDKFRPSLRPRTKSISSIEEIGVQPCVEIKPDFVILDSFIGVS